MAALSPCLKCTLPWQLTALTSFLGIGPGAAEGLLNRGSETLPTAMSSSAPQWWNPLLVPCGSAPQRPLVSGKHDSLLPCSAPSLALTSSHTARDPFSLDLPSRLNPVFGADEHNHPAGMEWKTNKNKREGGKIPSTVGADRCFIFHGESRDGYFTHIQKHRSFVL